MKCYALVHPDPESQGTLPQVERGCPSNCILFVQGVLVFRLLSIYPIQRKQGVRTHGQH